MVFVQQTGSFVLFTLLLVQIYVRVKPLQILFTVFANSIVLPTRLDFNKVAAFAIASHLIAKLFFCQVRKLYQVLVHVNKQ